MKILENKTTTLKLSEDSNVKYSDLLNTVIDKPVREGLSINDLRRDIKLLNVIKDAKDEKEMKFEDEDFKHVVQAVNDSKWVVRHQDILDFVDYINSI